MGTSPAALRLACDYDLNLYNDVRAVGYEMGLLLGEGLIGAASLQIVEEYLYGFPTNPTQLVEYSKECGAQDAGQFRPITTEEAKRLLATKPKRGWPKSK
jgi:hypothetical protein